MLSRADERGFTLVELAVAMSLMLLVSGALLAALESGTNAERRASTRIDDEQSVALVLAQFTRDVRNAAPWSSDSPPTPLFAAAADSVELHYANGDDVVWSYTATSGVLQRTLNGNAGVSLGGLTNASGTVFQVLAADGSNLLVDASTSPPSVFPPEVITCAVTVTASVTSSAHPPSEPFTETASAPVEAPGVDRRGCP